MRLAVTKKLIEFKKGVYILKESVRILYLFINSRYYNVDSFYKELFLFN